MQVAYQISILSLILFSIYAIASRIRIGKELARLRRKYTTLLLFVRGINFKTTTDLIRYISESYFSRTGSDVIVSYRTIYMPEGYVQVFKNGRYIGQTTEAQLRNNLKKDMKTLSVNANITLFAEDLELFQNTMELLKVLFNAAMNYDELYSQAGIDELTGLKNRMALERYVKEIYPLLVKNGRVSFVMMDVDDFKHFNDEYGHETGDIVLKRVAGSILQSVKKSDFPFRFGGDEMGIIIKGDSKVAEAVVRRIIENLNSKNDYNVTLSIGIAESRGEEKFEHLQGRADTALYKAKAEGKGRYEVAL